MPHLSAVPLHPVFWRYQGPNYWILRLQMASPPFRPSVELHVLLLQDNAGSLAWWQCPDSLAFAVATIGIA
jgi:hypothetical protein